MDSYDSYIYSDSVSDPKITFGALRSPIDNRDLIAENLFPQMRSLLEPLPIILDYRDELKSIRDQEEQGTCAAQTGCAMKEWQERDITKAKLSPQFVYNLRENKPQEGMYGRDLMRILQEYGICHEKSYPYYSTHEIPKEVFQEAKNLVIKSYARVDSMEGLKESLFRNGPCYIAFPVYNYESKFWFQKDNESYLGGHAVTVVGYNEDGFILRNSWGKYWGNKGYTTYPYEEWGKHWEIWTCIDAESVPEKQGCKCVIL